MRREELLERRTMEKFLVSASTGAMGSILKKLGTILSDEYKLLKGVRDNIKFLKDELEAMQAFLIEMADMEKPDKQAKLRADVVREMSYEIEDNIDKFMVLIEHEPSSESDGFGKLFSKTMKKIKDIKTRHKIAKDIKDIKIQVKEISARYSRYKIDESSRPRNKKIDPRLCAVYKDASELVGIDGPREELVTWLSKEKGASAHQLKVVSIVGYGGLGKTTLAKQVYDKLAANYECRAFVSISRSPDMLKILSSILSQLRNQNNACAGDEQHIIDQIRNFLRDKRYLIVIDDVWDVQTWKTLDCALVRNSCGSVIISTTRIHNVAQSCCSSDVDLIHEIQPLGIADSKKLFFKRIFGCEEKCPHNLKEASEDILKKCGGLPLAISAISSLLATEKTLEEWDQIRSSIGFAQETNSDIDAMNYILSLSYFDLPLYLRSCLLYLTMFPEDHEIERDRLVYKWISEGLIHGREGEDLVKLGDEYFHELINRSLTQPVGIGYDGKALYCRVHDTVLDFLIYKSNEENFCTFLSNHPKADGKVRRLSLMGNEDQGNVEQLDLSHARSLCAFGNSRKYLPSLAKLNALRVLDIGQCFELGNHHVKDIGRLFQLRYLNIHLTNITEIPREIGDLEYLETLNVRNTELLELPESVTRLKRLARLFVSVRTKLPDCVGKMEKLQELGNIDTSLQSVKCLEELGKLKNLRKMRIRWDTSELDKSSCKGEKLVSSLCELNACKLRNLYITVFLGEEDGLKGHQSFPALSSIRTICLCRGQLCWITKWLVSLPNLEELSVLGGTKIEQQDVEMVGKITTLLQFSGNIRPIVITTDAGFQQLQVLALNCGVTGLTFQAGAMPNLKKIQMQIHLSQFKSEHGVGVLDDFGFQHLSSLALLDIEMDCRDSRAANVEAAEDAVKSMAETHPKHPTLKMKRVCEEQMLQDE